MTPVGALCRTLYAPRTFSERCHRNHCRSGLALPPARRAMRRTKPHLDVSLHSSEPASAAVTPELYFNGQATPIFSLVSPARSNPSALQLAGESHRLAGTGDALPWLWDRLSLSAGQRRHQHRQLEQERLRRLQSESLPPMARLLQRYEHVSRWVAERLAWPLSARGSGRAGYRKGATRAMGDERLTDDVCAICYDRF